MPARLNILLVDDERAFREQFCDWFQEHEIVGVVDATEAIKNFHNRPNDFHAVVLDYTLPAGEDPSLKDGLEVLRRMLQIRGNIPVIVVTGAGDRDVAREALRIGAYWYLEKPLDRVETEVLLNSIGRWQVAAQTIAELRSKVEPDLSWLELSHALVSEKEIGDLLEKIARHASAILKTENCTVVTLTEEGKIKFGIPRWEGRTPTFRSHYDGRSLTRELAEKGEYHLVADAEQEPDLTREFRDSSIRAFAGVACPQEPGARAVLYAYYNHVLDLEEVDRLKARLIPLARVTGMAIERLRQEKLNQALVSAGGKLLQARSDAEIYQIVRETLENAFEVSTFYLALYDEKTNTIQFPFLVDKGKEYPTGPFQNTEEEGGLTGYIIRTGEEVDSADISNDHDLPVAPKRVGEGNLSQAYLGTPLRLPDGKVRGVISVQRYVPRRFLEPSKQALRTLAAEVALALERLRADQAREQVLERLTSRPWQEVLREIAQNVRDATGADIVTVHPYDARKKTFSSERIRLGLTPAAESEPFSGEENYTLERLLEKKEHFAENVAVDAIFAGEFSRRFEIVSSGGIVLYAGEIPQPVGVLVVNYRSLKQFDDNLKEELRRHGRRASLILHTLWMQKREDAAHRRIAAEHQAIDAIRHTSDRGSLFEKLMEIIKNAWLESDVEIIPSLMLVDPGQRKLYFPEEVKGWYQIDDPNEAGREAIAFGEGICGWVAVNRQSLIVSDVSKDDRYLSLKSTTRSEICVPIKLGDNLLGVLDVESSLKNFFDDESRVFLERIADELAIQWGAYGKLEYAEKVISAAMEAARQPDEALNELTRQAYEIAGLGGGKPTFVTIFLATSQGLEVASAHPPEYLDRIRQQGKATLMFEPPAGVKKGVVVRAFQKKETEFIQRDASQDPDYIMIDENTQAELAVPIFAPDGAALGVINIEYAEPGALSEEDKQLVETLARQTTVVAMIQKQARDLAEIRRLENESTALAMLGIEGVEYGHGWKNAAAALQGTLDLLRDEFQNYEMAWSGKLAKRLHLAPDFSRVNTWLARSIRLVTDLQKSSRLGLPTKNMSNVPVADWLQKQIQRWEERAEAIEFRLEPLETCNCQIHANEQWLTRALDNLLANAVRAASKQSKPQVGLRCVLIDSKIRIEIPDNGPGVPDDVRPYLFVSMVPENLEGKYGWGVGCLIAQFIVRSYGGRAYLLKSDKEGTVTALELPVVEGSPVSE